METEGGGESQTPPKTPFGVIIPALAVGAALNCLGLTMVSTLPISGLIVGLFGGGSIAYGPILFAPRFALHSRPLGALSLIGAIMAACFQANEGFFAIVLICAVCIGLVTWGADRVLWVRKILKQRCRN